MNFESPTLPETLSSYLRIHFYGNTLLQWLLFLTLLTFIRFSFLVIQRRGSKRLSHSPLPRIILTQTQGYFLTALTLFLASFALQLSVRIELFLRNGIVLLFLLQSGIWATSLLEVWIQDRISKDTSPQKTMASTSGLLRLGGKFLIFSLLTLMALNNLGVDITALIAGLGVGGIAVALAVQNILGDLFASLTIVLDKPFVIGDAINTGEVTGTIEHIGLKTTRLRSLTGEQIIIANSDLLQSRIKNFKRMEKRRVAFWFGVTYSTPPILLRQIPELTKTIIEGETKTEFERTHLLRLGDSAVEFEVVYWILDPDYVAYADRHQRILLQLIETLQQHQVDFAFPSRTVYQVTQSASHSPATPHR